jgi:hypothetical protein
MGNISQKSSCTHTQNTAHWLGNSVCPLPDLTHALAFHFLTLIPSTYTPGYLYYVALIHIIHALLKVPMGTLAATFRWLGVENSVAYYLGILDHVKEVMLDTFAEVGLPLFIGFNDSI